MPSDEPSASSNHRDLVRHGENPSGAHRTDYPLFQMRGNNISVAIAGGDTAQPRNMAKRIALIASIRPLWGLDVLDMGCGEGAYVVALAEAGANAHGVEFEAAKVEGLRRRHPDFDSVVQGDIENLPFEDGSFDLVLLNEVLEHVPHQERALGEARRVLRPDGRLVILSPNRLYPFETHGVYLRHSGRRLPHTVPFVPYVPLRLGTRIFKYWARNYWPWELRSAVRRARFEVVSVDFVWQTFENVSRNQPVALRITAPLLRLAAGLAEKVPGMRAFGVSQVVLAQPN